MDDGSSFDDSDVSSPETDTEHDLLCSSGLVFEPDDIWRVEFPANGVFSESIEKNPEETIVDANPLTSSESDGEEMTMASSNWEAKMLVEEFEKNRRRSNEDMMLWNWMISRKSLQDWRKLQRQNRDNRMKRKHSLVDERTLNSWSSGMDARLVDTQLDVHAFPHFLSTDHLQEAPKSKSGSPHNKSKRSNRTDIATSSISNQKLQRRRSLHENRKLSRNLWPSLDDSRELNLVSSDRHLNSRSEKKEKISDIPAGVLGWPSSPCLPTITEDDYISRLSCLHQASSVVSRSYSQDCLTSRSASAPFAEPHTEIGDDGASERHSESSEHGEESPLIPFAQCSDENVIITLPEYETLLDP